MNSQTQKIAVNIIIIIFGPFATQALNAEEISLTNNANLIDHYVYVETKNKPLAYNYAKLGIYIATSNAIVWDIIGYDLYVASINTMTSNIVYITAALPPFAVATLFAMLVNVMFGTALSEINDKRLAATYKRNKSSERYRLLATFCRDLKNALDKQRHAKWK